MLTDAEKSVYKILIKIFKNNFPKEFTRLISKECHEKYNALHQYLDNNFLDQITDKETVNSRLWELIIAEILSKSSAIIPTNTSKKKKGFCPDFKIQTKDNKIYYIEAMCAYPPEQKAEKKSEIDRVINEFESNGKVSSDSLLIQEDKSRISEAIIKKADDRHRELITNENVGYVLCMSYGYLPFFASCDLYHAIETVIPIGNLAINLEIKHNAETRVISNPYLLPQDSYIKPFSSGSRINTHILGNPEYDFISAILFSRVNPLLLLEYADTLPEVNWNGIRNDFVLIHNPIAVYPLTEDIFGCRTSIKIQDGRIEIEGTNIFPTF